MERLIVELPVELAETSSQFILHDGLSREKKSNNGRGAIRKAGSA